MICASPARPAEAKLARMRAELAKLKADALVVSDPHAVAWAVQHPRRRRGAYAAAARLRDRAGRRPPLRSIVDGRKLSNDVRHRLEDARRRARAGRFRPTSRRSAPQKRIAAARPGDRRRCAGAPHHGQRWQGRPRRRSDRADEGGEERYRDCRRARRARARRRRGRALPRLVRPRGAAGQAHRDRRGRRRWKASAATPACSRTFRFRPLPAPAPTARSCIIASPARPTATIAPGELFLVDSGGQYEDGTTDITRTIAVGTPTAEMRDRFTRVLKGHIAIARAVFPDGTTGAQLDSFARQFLWAGGLDFDHGTGHGVGSYLSVHEGPARISKLGTVAAQARHDPVERARLLQSRRLRHPDREPGAGGRPAEIAGGAEKPLNAFETLTLAPIDRALVVRGDAHAPTKSPGSTPIMRASPQTLAPLVDAETRAWLAAATRPLGRRLNPAAVASPDPAAKDCHASAAASQRRGACSPC